MADILVHNAIKDVQQAIEEGTTNIQYSGVHGSELYHYIKAIIDANKTSAIVLDTKDNPIEIEDLKEFFRKSIEFDALDPKIVIWNIPYFFLYMGRNEFQKAFEVTKEILEHSPNAGLVKGFKASVMGFLDYGNEAKQALDEYLELRPNLKTRADFKKSLK